MGALSWYNYNRSKRSKWIKTGIEQALRAYKKREKSLQRRITVEAGVNKRLKLLLTQCNEQIPDGLLKDMVEHELKMLKYKYY